MTSYRKQYDQFLDGLYNLMCYIECFKPTDDLVIGDSQMYDEIRQYQVRLKHRHYIFMTSAQYTSRILIDDVSVRYDKLRKQYAAEFFESMLAKYRHDLLNEILGL